MFMVKSARQVRKVRGLTLLEVLISISLICTTMVAFAAVYPASFRMTRKTNRVNQATQLAMAVAEELRDLKTGDPSGSLYTKDGNYIEHFVTGDGSNTKKVLTKDGLEALHFPRMTIPEPFTLVQPNESGVTSGSSPTGICVTCGEEKTSGQNYKFYQIEVTMYWMEGDTNGVNQIRSATVVSGKSDNVLRSRK